MTRKPRRLIKRPTSPHPDRKGRGKAAPIAVTPADPLDDVIEATAHALGIKIDPAWMPAIRANLQVTLRLGTVVTGFALSDDAEPAPVFKS